MPRTPGKRRVVHTRKSEPSKSTAVVPKAAPPPRLELRPLALRPEIIMSAMRQPATADAARVANTIVYVHGINNKPPASVLKCQWDTALFNTQLGDRSRMSYWVNRDYYPVPLSETCASGDVVNIDDDEASTRAIMALARGESGDEELALSREISALTTDPARQAWLTKVAAKLLVGTAVSNAELAAKDVRAKVLPIPPFLRRLVTRKLTRAFLRDVNDFLFVAERRDAMEASFLDRLSAGGGPFVVIAHSQGSMIAYDVLRRLERTSAHVPLFITIGSPLGLAEVQDVLRQWTGGRLPFPPCVDRWLNVADRLDPVAFDTDISNDFEGRIENVAKIGINPDSPHHPHSGTGYLKVEQVRTAVRKAVGPSFGQAVTQFVIAKDLSRDMEDAHRDERHPVLIQLAEERSGDPANPKRLENLATLVETKINEIVRIGKADPEEDAELERLRHFVSARLTRLEVETLRTLFADLQIDAIWRNASKRALVKASTHTVQARPANLGYGANGEGICWAVLDTGIRADHPHFHKYNNVVDQWDCTKAGAPRRLARGGRDFIELDRDGHGTHVAGIIAGEYAVPAPAGDAVLFAGMAPRCSLYGFKVLDDQGNGRDSWIIKALDTIADLNTEAGQLVVHGVNLSLGGSFDPSVFNVGHTPLCQELRRLWRQGVLVVLAAGNEGYVILSGGEGEIQANLDLTIGDPANLDEAIAVGSVHKTNPHTYGVSFFSSRGPTADGRRKPDVVAPGEKILSARHDWKPNVPGEDALYVSMSGTSMAAPHVSGVLAAFLSLRREFVGYPDRVKSILLESCIDLRRDIYMQGSGLPNLIKMLAFN
jgi:subtilisin family serine protease